MTAGRSGPQRWLVRWSGTVSSWADASGACAAAGVRNGRVRLVIDVGLLEPGRALIEAWLELPGRRQAVLGPAWVSCERAVEGGMLHVDVTDGEARLLALSVDLSRDRLLYARTSLLDTLRFGAGTFDPPTLEKATVGRDVASA